MDIGLGDPPVYHTTTNILVYSHLAIKEISQYGAIVSSGVASAVW
jgi:hypothetical protein